MTTVLTDEQYDVADRIDAILDANRDETYSPSQMARKAKTDSYTARAVLHFMADNRMAVAGGNGAWTRYSYRPLFSWR